MLLRDWTMHWHTKAVLSYMSSHLDLPIFLLFRRSSRHRRILPALGSADSVSRPEYHRMSYRRHVLDIARVAALTSVRALAAGAIAVISTLICHYSSPTSQSPHTGQGRAPSSVMDVLPNLLLPGCAVNTQKFDGSSQDYVWLGERDSYSSRRDGCNSTSCVQKSGSETGKKFSHVTYQSVYMLSRCLHAVKMKDGCTQPRSQMYGRKTTDQTWDRYLEALLLLDGVV